MLKEELRSIVNSNYSLPADKDEYNAIKEIMSILGSTDAELRDNLGYNILNKWLLQKNFLTNDQLEKILKEALSEKMLFNRIGESETDSVFLRSFSSLLIALILIRDNRAPFLSQVSVRFVLDCLEAYCEEEKDYRGFVAGKGWAHAPAHISDVIDECVRNRYVEKKECERLWICLLNLLQGPNVLTAEEDERITNAVVAMIELGKVPLTKLLTWIEEVEVIKERNLLSENRRINFKHFLRCLFYRLKEKDLLGIDEVRLFVMEKKFNPFNH